MSNKVANWIVIVIVVIGTLGGIVWMILDNTVY